MDEDLQHVNPCPPDWLSDEQKEKLRGDNIEGTAYNQRWVLSSLMTVWNALHDLLPSLQKETNIVRYDITPLQSSQPAATNGASAPETPLLTPQHAAADATPSYAASEEDQPIGGASPPRQDVVEVPEDVERNVCELWDMCANKHVAKHVLEQGDQVVLQMLDFALKDPTAPRLTETLCGLVYNICHQDEGCKAVLQNELLVHLLVSLPERCNDSSVLVQAFSLLHRLVYYLNRLQRAESRVTPDCSDTKPTTDLNGADTMDETSFGVVGNVNNDFPSSMVSISVVRQTSQEAHNVNNTRPDDLNDRSHDRVKNKEEGSTDGAGGSSAAAAQSEEMAKFMASLLHTCNIEHFLAFILHHSLHAELLATTVRLLEELLFFKDPVTGAYLAEHYAETGVVPGLLRLVSDWHRQQKRAQAQHRRQEAHLDDDFDTERPASASRLEDDRRKISPVVHSAFICLYAFVDTKAEDFIVSYKSGQASLEPALVVYISELVSSVETQLRHLKNLPPRLESQDDCDVSLSMRLTAEKLGCCLTLLGLLKRSFTLPEVILGLARLLALLEHSGIAWEDDDKYNKGNENEQPDQPELEVFDDVSNNHSCFLPDFPSTNEDTMAISPPKCSNPNKVVNFLDLNMMAVEKNASEDDERGKLRERDLRKKQHQEYQRQMRLRSGSRARRRSSLRFDDVTHIQDSEEISVSEGTLVELRDLRRSLEMYFANTLHYWFTFGDLKDKRGVLCSIIVVLEQCHMHEVLLVLDAAKKFEAGLVAKIQETLLDHQAFPRMVALLAQLYQ